jgi:hypothetical protein
VLAQPAKQSQVPLSQRDLVRDGLAAFRSDKGGPIPTPNYAGHRLRYLLDGKAHPIYFTYRHEIFTQTYRVICVVEPTFAYRADGPILTPIPPFFQAYRPDMVAMGMALGRKATPPSRPPPPGCG